MSFPKGSPLSMTHLALQQLVVCGKQLARTGVAGLRSEPEEKSDSEISIVRVPEYGLLVI